MRENLTNLNILINFLNEINEIVILTYPGADFGYNNYIKLIKNIKNKKIHIIKSLGINHYYQFLKHSNLVIGNSSSGIIETGAFKIPTLNIGNRQKLRFKNKNVFNANFNSKELRYAYKKLISKSFLIKLKRMKDIYKTKISSGKLINKLLT